MITEINSAIYFKSKDEWRSWLEENHERGKEVWLIHYKKRSGKIGLTYNDAVNEAICFGWIDGKMKSIDEDKFILRYSLRKPKSVWSKTFKRPLRIFPVSSYLEAMEPS